MWLQVLNNTIHNQSCSIIDLKERFYTNFKAEKFSQYIQQFITSLPQQLSDIFACKYHCFKCNKVYNLFSTQQRQECDQCGGNLLLQKSSSIQIQFIDKQQQILRKTIINNQDYVLYTVLGCKKEDDFKFYQILVDFEFIQSDQLYILSRPQNCLLKSKVDPLTYLKPEKVHKYLQNQKENSVAKTIGQPQMVMYFNAKDLQGRAKQNVAEQFDIQEKEEPIQEVQQPQIVQPIVLPKVEKQPEPTPVLKQDEPLQPQVEVTNYGYIAVLFYIISIILLFITMVIISYAIGKVTNNYKPNGLIIKNNLIFEGEQGQSNLQQNQIKQLQSSNKDCQKTLVINNVNISDLTFNNTRIDNYVGDQNTCQNIQLTQSNLQTAKNVNIQADNFTADTLQTSWSRVQANNSQINVLTAQSINLQSINSTTIESVQYGSEFNDLHVSTAQTSDLNCNKTLYSSGVVIADGSEIKSTINSNISTIDKLNGADLEVTRQLIGDQIDSNQIQIYSNISQFTINSEQETILNGNITSRNIVLNNQTSMQNVSADSFQVQNGAVTINQQLDTQNLNGTTASNISVQDTLQAERSQTVRFQGNNLTIVDQGNITSYFMNVSTEGNITVNQTYKTINFDNTQIKIEDNSNVTLQDINFNIPNLTLQGNKIQIENITTNNITEAKQIDTNQLEGTQSQIQNYTISNNTRVTSTFNKLDNVTLNAKIYTTLAEKYTMKKRYNDTIEQDLIGYDNQVKGIYITTDFNRANRYKITNGSVEEFNATGKQPPTHPILLDNGIQTQQLNRVEQIIHETSQPIIKVKNMLQQRQQLMKNKSGASLTEIATLSSKITLEFTNVDQAIKQIEQELILYQNKQLTQEQQENYEKLKSQRQLLIDSEKKLKNWLLNEQQQSEVSPFSKVEQSVKFQKKQDAQQSQTFVAQEVLKQQGQQSLDDLLPQFANIEEAKAEVKKQDEQLESTAASMLPKVQQIAAQVQKHKELLDLQEEQMLDVKQNIKVTTEKVKGINQSTQDIQKRLMKGDKCLTIIIIVLMILIGAYWIFKIVL